MVDETLFESVQDGEVNKKSYYVKSYDERDDEAKAPTRQITGHKDLLFSSVLDESATNAVEMQQAEFVTAVYRKCRDIKESLQEMKSGRHIRAKPRANRPMIPAR